MDERRKPHGPIGLIAEAFEKRILPLVRDEPVAAAVLVFMAVIAAATVLVFAGAQFIEFK